MNIQPRPPTRHHSIKRQRGVAIITALLIVAIAATISTTISTRLQLDIRRTGNMITLDQARYYTLAAEDWSARILKKDLEKNKIDDLNEDWAIAMPPLPVEGGTIQGRLTDLTACINLNTLLDTNGKVDQIVVGRFERLFTNAGIKEKPPTQAILDWIDADLRTRTPDGAEDGYYLNLDPPYRSANIPLQSITTLRLIKGFEDPQILRKILPGVCAYPPGEQANRININTARKEVLKSLAAGLTDSIADAIIERRKNKPFTNLQDFINFDQLKTIIKDTRGISFSSDTFLLRAQANIGRARLVVYSILRRDPSGKITVLARSQRNL